MLPRKLVYSLADCPRFGREETQDRSTTIARLYSTAKQKLLEGKQVFSFT